MFGPVKESVLMKNKEKTSFTVRTNSIFGNRTQVSTLGFECSNIALPTLFMFSLLVDVCDVVIEVVVGTYSGGHLESFFWFQAF